MGGLLPNLNEYVRALSRLPSGDNQLNLVPVRTLSFGRKYSRAAVSVLAFVGVTFFGYKLHYLEAGRGEPIILLHGSGGEGARWMPTATRSPKPPSASIPAVQNCH